VLSSLTNELHRESSKNSTDGRTNARARKSHRTHCEHTRILGALVEHQQGNLEEIQQRNPAEHPRGTCRPSGPQGLDVRHRALRSQPCTASADAGEAIRTLVPVASLPRPLLRGRTYLCTIPGASQGYRYVPSTNLYVRETRATQR